MPTFIPPLEDSPAPIGGRSHPLWRHYGNFQQGKTVWKDQSDIWHQSSFPYQGGFVDHHFNDDQVVVNTDTSPLSLANAKKIYYGGSVYTISEAEYNELIAAGFSPTILSESFNKPDGALGPLLTWTRQVFTNAHPYSVVGNQARIGTDEESTIEDLQYPFPNVSSRDVTVTIPVESFNATGLHYLADTGTVTRFQTYDGGANYRGYACAVGKSRDIFIPGTVLWHLIVARIDGVGVSEFLDVAIGGASDVVLPGTLTITSQDTLHSAVFTHSGPGPALSVDAVDDRWFGGAVVMGGSAVAGPGSTAEIFTNSFDAREIIS